MPLPTDRERTELYAYNPRTDSNIQIDITPAGPYAAFNQEKIELLTTVATESLRSELDEHHGKNAVPMEIGPTKPAALKGVPYAAKKHVAAEQCRNALRSNPLFLQARFTLGCSLYRLERYKEAMEEFETLLRMDPGDEQAGKFRDDIQRKLR